MRRKGFPSCAQLLRVGRATLLHQHSSSKAVAHSGSEAEISISRSRLLFSFVEGVGGGDPTLRSHPSHSEKAHQSRSDGLPGDPSLGESFLEGRWPRKGRQPGSSRQTRGQVAAGGGTRTG